MTRSKQDDRGTPAASQSRHYHELAKARIAGGVNSNVRLSNAPVCFASGKGSRLTDVDGNVYIDYALGMGPTILGHAPPPLRRKSRAHSRSGSSLPGSTRSSWSSRTNSVPASSRRSSFRFGLSGSEMVQAAIRVARAYTGRPEIIKFEGHYHGWFDNILINMNPPVAAEGNPIPRPRHLQSGGQSAHASDDFAVLPWNDAGAIDQYVGANASRIAAIITEPIMFNTGGILPKPGYLEHLCRVTKEHGIVLIFDEVITGFRVALGGAQELYDIKPDLSVFAKALGAGFPVAALGGRRDIMEMFASGGVNHSGTYNANLVSLSAALASLRELSANDQAAYKRINSAGKALMEGIAAAGRRHGADLQVSGLPSAFHTCFTSRPIHDYATYSTANQKKLALFLSALLESGVRPTSRGTWFVSAAHTDADVASTLDAVEQALQRIM